MEIYFAGWNALASQEKHTKAAKQDMGPAGPAAEIL